jgi:uncharacterized membrane protein YhiD involved in acid resistance
MNPSNVLKVDLTPGQVALSFLLAFALSFIWATVYRKTHSGVAYTRSFFLTLMLISPTVAMVMLAIGSNVALSLGLVGALSIIRFRTVIKDAKDMVFLFLSIGIGLCSGANAWMVAVIGTAMVSLITVLMSRIGHDRAGSADYILIFRSSQKEPWNALSAAARDMVSWRQLRGATDVDSGKEFEYTYNVRLASKTAPECVIGEFGKNEAIRQVTMIAPENHLDL